MSPPINPENGRDTMIDKQKTQIRHAMSIGRALTDHECEALMTVMNIPELVVLKRPDGPEQPNSETCKTCRWWVKNGGGINAPVSEGMGACKVAETIDGKYREHETIGLPLMAAVDGEQCEAHLMTNPDYRCIHHEQKD